MGKVINFNGESVEDVTSDQVIDGLKEYGVGDLVAIGVAKDGGLYIASESKDIGHLLLRLEQAKAELVRISMVTTQIGDAG